MVDPMDEDTKHFKDQKEKKNMLNQLHKGNETKWPTTLKANRGILLLSNVGKNIFFFFKKCSLMYLY